MSTRASKTKRSAIATSALFATWMIALLPAPAAAQETITDELKAAWSDPVAYLGEHPIKSGAAIGGGVGLVIGCISPVTAQTALGSLGGPVGILLGTASGTFTTLAGCVSGTMVGAGLGTAVGTAVYLGNEFKETVLDPVSDVVDQIETAGAR